MVTILPPPGLALPDFSSLLVKGDYHASAPVYLAISHVQASDGHSVVLLAPSRARLSAEVKELNDSWLNAHGGEGRVVAAAKEVNML